MSSSSSTNESTSSRSNLKAAGVVILVALLLSVLLGGLLYRNYAKLLSYVHHTLTHPETPPPWIADGPLSPEACVDATLDWSSGCVGIKALCDEYTTRVTMECLAEGDHVDYCTALGSRTATTEFGLQECYARGTRRHFDSESCANAYRAIDSYCAFLRDSAAIERGETPIGPPSARPRKPADE